MSADSRLSISGATRLNLRHRFEQLPGNAQGAVWLLFSSLLISVMSLAAKMAGSELVLGGEQVAEPLPEFVITFFRSVATLLATLPFILRHGASAVSSSRPFMAVTRGMLGAGGMLCNFYAVIHLPLAMAIAIQFARPLFLLVLAAVVLGEIVTGRRGLATVIGFLGVLVIVRPGPTMEVAAAVALLGCLLLASSIVLLRILARTDGTVALIFYSGVAGTLFTAIPALQTWQTPTLLQGGLLTVMAVFGVAGQSCFMKGYAAGEASAMAPFDYSRLLFATLWGFVVFGELPDVWTWLGSGILLGATWYALILQRQGEPLEDH